MVCDFPLLSQTVRDSHVCLFVYDVSDRASFEALSKFHNSLQPELSKLPSSMDSQCKKKPMFVVANKVDLLATNRVVAKLEGQEFAARIGAKYLETSAKHDVGVTEAIAMAITYGLIQCAEVALPDLRKAVAERAREQDRVAECRRQHKYPYTSPSDPSLPDNTRSDGTRKTIMKSVREFVGKTFAKLRS